MPIDPRIPSSSGDPAGVANRFADLERRIRLLTTRSGGLGRQSGVGSAVVTWNGVTGYSSFATVSGTGSVAGVVGTATIASNGKTVVLQAAPASDNIIAYAADGSLPANGTTCTIYFQWWK